MIAIKTVIKNSACIYIICKKRLYTFVMYLLVIHCVYNKYNNQYKLRKYVCEATHIFADD